MSKEGNVAIIPKYVQDAERALAEAKKNVLKLNELNTIPLFGNGKQLKETPAVEKANEQLRIAILKGKNEICQTLERALIAGSFPSHWSFVGNKMISESIVKTQNPGKLMKAKKGEHRDEFLHKYECYHEWNTITVSLFDQRIKYIDTPYNAVAEVKKMKNENFGGCVKPGHLMKIYAIGDPKPVCTFDIGLNYVNRVLKSTGNRFKNIKDLRQHQEDYSIFANNVESFHGLNMALYDDVMDNVYEPHDVNEYIPQHEPTNEHLGEMATALMVVLTFLFVCVGSCVVGGIGGFFLGRQSTIYKRREHNEI